MPGYASVSGQLGFGPVADMFTPDTTQRFTLGQVIDAIDPYFGWGRFIYLKTAAATVNGTLVYWDNSYVATAMPSTANLGYPVAVSRQAFSAADQYGWFQLEGNCPIKCSASVATGVAAGLGTAGVLGTNSAGKQVLGLRVHQASTFTITKAARTTNGSPFIEVSNVDGLFVGLTLSGTGVGAGTISSIDPSGNRVTNSANSTATGAITLTGTYTGYLLCGINNPFTQGAIT